MSAPISGRWLRVLVLLERALRLHRTTSRGAYSDQVATDTDGRTVAPVLVAMERAGLVSSIESALARSHHAARLRWTITPAGREALRTLRAVKAAA